MANREDNGITILLGLKGYNLGEIWVFYIFLPGIRCQQLR